MLRKIVNGSQHNFLGLSEKRCQVVSSTAEVMFSSKFHFSCEYSVVTNDCSPEIVKGTFYFHSSTNFHKIIYC